jgi:small conductance mechanosensitive channel
VTIWMLASEGGVPGLPTEAPDDAREATQLILDTLAGLWTTFVAKLPVIGIALVVFVIGAVLAGFVSRHAAGALRRTSADPNVITLVDRLLRLSLIVAVALLSLSMMGVPVSAALASLGLAGLAVAFALQNILENFVSGVLLLARKPFRVGEQIRTGEHEGTVSDIDLRVTRLVDYDGETVLIPNADVFRSALINLTRRGRRRTRVMIGIDYRDDHDAAREVIRSAVASTDGVLGDPEVEVLLTELGESSVDFEVRYWTLPDIRSVRHTQDRVLSAAKRAIEEAGMTIPWPIRTLVLDDAVRVERADTGRDA